jgi:acylphosphatase
MKLTKHVIVHGRVQGVNYRESMRLRAPPERKAQRA